MALLHFVNMQNWRLVDSCEPLFNAVWCGYDIKLLRILVARISGGEYRMLCHDCRPLYIFLQISRAWLCSLDRSATLQCMNYMSGTAGGLASITHRTGSIFFPHTVPRGCSTGGVVRLSPGSLPVAE